MCHTKTKRGKAIHGEERSMRVYKNSHKNRKNSNVTDHISLKTDLLHPFNLLRFLSLSKSPRRSPGTGPLTLSLFGYFGLWRYILEFWRFGKCKEISLATIDIITHSRRRKTFFTEKKSVSKRFTRLLAESLIGGVS